MRQKLQNNRAMLSHWISASIGAIYFEVNEIPSSLDYDFFLYTWDFVLPNVLV